MPANEPFLALFQAGGSCIDRYVESFNVKLRDELPNREVFNTLLEAKLLIERWRRAYNTVRPHSPLGYQPPAPEANKAGQVALPTLT